MAACSGSNRGKHRNAQRGLGAPRAPHQGRLIALTSSERAPARGAASTRTRWACSRRSSWQTGGRGWGGIAGSSEIPCLQINYGGLHTIRGRMKRLACCRRSSWQTDGRRQARGWGGGGCGNRSDSLAWESVLPGRVRDEGGWKTGPKDDSPGAHAHVRAPVTTLTHTYSRAPNRGSLVPSSLQDVSKRGSPGSTSSFLARSS